MSSASEKTLLLEETKEKRRNFASGLSVLFAIICIVDVFGVFPIVALPKSIIDCGYYGVLVVLLVSCTQIYTATLLGRCWLIAEKIDSKLESKNRYPYSALAELTLGSKFATVVTFFLDFAIFSGGIPNLIVASQTLQLLGRRVSENSFDLSSCFWIIIIGALMCPLLWLGSPKDMKLLSTLSVVMVISVFLSVVGAMIFDTRTRINQEPDLESIESENIWINLFSAYGIITFQFDIHPIILTIQVDMDEKQKIPKAIFGGFLGSLSMFTITTLVAFWRYGTETKSSLLGSLPAGLTLHFAALLVALQLGLTLAVSNSALYQHMENCLGISREFNHKRCLLRTALCILAILFAEIVPRFDLVMSLIGGSFIGPLAFILPPLFHLKIMQLKKQHDEQVQLAVFNKLVYDSEIPENVTNYLQAEEADLEVCGKCSAIEIGFSLIIVLLGACFTLGTTYLNIFNIVQYASFSQPCLYNLTFVSPL